MEGPSHRDMLPPPPPVGGREGCNRIVFVLCYYIGVWISTLYIYIDIYIYIIYIYTIYVYNICILYMCSVDVNRG